MKELPKIINIKHIRSNDFKESHYFFYLEKNLDLQVNRCYNKLAIKTEGVLL